MTGKVEWEVVEEAEPASQQAHRKPLEVLLGPWWRWKVAAIALGATVALVFFATVSGVILLLVAAAAILSAGTGRVGQWLRNVRTRPH